MRSFVLTGKNNEVIRSYLKTLPQDGTYKMEIKKNASNRSDAQNRLSHKWYAERSIDTGLSPIEEKNYCKLIHGCPILIAEDDDFASFYNEALAPLSYEAQLRAMVWVPVTSTMNTKQMSVYMNQMDEEAASVGIMLSRPEDLYYAAMGLRRTKVTNGSV